MTTEQSSIPFRPADAADENQDAARARLEAEASRRYAWHYEEITIGGQVRQFATASDPDQLLLEACERESEGDKTVEDPYWAAVWQAAVGLDEFLADMDIAGTPILELGAGTGRAGLGAALRGAHVTITDGMIDPLYLAELSTLDLPKCEVCQLRWGEHQLNQVYPLILGSDVTYNRGLWPLLMQAVDQHLAEDGLLLLTDPERFISNEFAGWVVKQGWEYAESHVPHCEDPSRRIRVMNIRRKRLS